MRYRLTIEYDGTDFCGWQSQANGLAVQDVLGAAIEKFCGAKVTIFGAGRTDAGVHARGQVAHIDLPESRAPREPYKADVVRDALNHHLRPNAVAVVAAAIARDDFDARFTASKRHYRYRLISRRAPPVLEAQHVWWVPRALDLAAMQAGADKLIGRHDFTTFRSSYCQAKSPIKTLDRLAVTQQDENFIVTASARSFLHNQMRSLVGALKLAGEGKWNADDIANALAARDRTACAPVAPACGLTLMAVDYPKEMLAEPQPK